MSDWNKQKKQEKSSQNVFRVHSQQYAAEWVCAVSRWKEYVTIQPEAFLRKSWVDSTQQGNNKIASALLCKHLGNESLRKLRLFKTCWINVSQPRESFCSSSICLCFGSGRSAEPITAVFDQRQGHKMDNGQINAGKKNKNHHLRENTLVSSFFYSSNIHYWCNHALSEIQFLGIHCN